MKTFAQKQMKALLGSGVGIFAFMALTAATATYIYSPVSKSEAVEFGTTRVSATVNPVASLALDTNNLSFSIIPTDAGTFSSQPITATVSTNSSTGYELYFSAEDNSTDMIHSDSSVSNVIASDFNGTVTSSTMAKNKWGYSLDNTDFLKIPTLANQTKIKDLDHNPSAAEKSTAVYIGTKISSDLASGRYSKNIKFSVLAHPVPAEPTMQGFDKSTLVNIGDSIELKDERDGRYYRVEKLRDGNVWMMSNLKLGKNEPMTLNSSDSDVAEDFVLPASSEVGFSEFDVKYVYVDEYGGFYNWNAATAGEGVRDLPGSTIMQHSICPKGWRLPTGGVNGEQQALYNAYDGDQLVTIAAAAVNEHGGFMTAGGIVSRGNDGSGKYWSSTAAGNYWAYNMGIYGVSSVDPTSWGNEDLGFSVRCVAR